MNQQRDLLAIGTFAKASLLTVKALRLYDQLDMLKPAYTDPSSGYRYYEVSQLEVARLIRMMRQMDMPLATIRLVLAAAPTEAELLVREYWHGMQLRVEQARRTVHDLISALKKENILMTLDVQVKTIPTQLVVSITKHVKVDKLEGAIQEGVAALNTLAKRNGLTSMGTPFGIYHGVIDHESDGPIEICLPVDRMIAVEAGTAAHELPETKVAAVMLTGTQCEFPEILKGYDAVFDWITQNGYNASASPRELWHRMMIDSREQEIAEVVIPFEA